MNSGAGTFDGLTRVYRALEFIAFGRDLERARFVFLDRLINCREILVLGEGDGRALAQLVKLAPRARIHCVDASPAMLARASARLTVAERNRVTFEAIDILTIALPAATFDAVTTMFFLDCFTPEQVRSILERVQPSLRPGARWLFADFSIPARGYARLRARVWVGLLYVFFRWQTKLEARALPPSEAIFALSGWRKTEEREFQTGLLRSVVFIQPGFTT
jgi:ubiquinone/menaquinone biosynthesis C-methylase UbiE